MVKPSKPPRNGFVRIARKLYNPLGFSKGYNFVLFFIFAGALLGFALARFQFLNYSEIFCPPRGKSTGAAPGECFYFGHGIDRIGMILHLAAMLPAGVLVVLQFIPAIRHKALIFHRVNGYVCIILGFVGTAGAIMATKRAFGGSVSTQTSLGLLGILFVGSLLLAYINIKRLQIEQHRAWMIRGWVYSGAIITARIIMGIGGLIIDNIGPYYTARPCAQVSFMVTNQTAFRTFFPECEPFLDGTFPDKWVAVPASFNSSVTAMSALGEWFGTAIWLATVLHVIGVEFYLRLTPVEHERLRQVSYQRQLEAGMKNPGRAGLTADRVGDSNKWEPNITHKENKRYDMVAAGDENTSYIPS